MTSKRILIVANQTAGGDGLKEAVRARMTEGPTEFTLLVPATPPAGTLTWTEGEAQGLAAWRMGDAVGSLRAAGARIRGRVGDARPLDAIEDALREEHFDEIIVSTLPPGPSRWLRQGLPRRAGRRFGIRITHVVDRSRGRSDPFARVEATLHRVG